MHCENKLKAIKTKTGRTLCDNDTTTHLIPQGVYKIKQTPKAIEFRRSIFNQIEKYSTKLVIFLNLRDFIQLIYKKI